MAPGGPECGGVMAIILNRTFSGGGPIVPCGQRHPVGCGGRLSGLPRLFEPVIRRQVPRRGQQVHQRLKEILEQGVTIGPALPRPGRSRVLLRIVQ